MAEQSLNGNGVHKVVDSTFYQWLGRFLLPIVLGAAMLFAGIVGGQVLATQAEMRGLLGVMQIDMAVMKNDISYLKDKVKP